MVDLAITSAKNVLHDSLSINSNIYESISPLTKSFLHENYIEKGLSVRQIAAQKISSKTAVLDALKRHNIPVRAPGNYTKNRKTIIERFGFRKVDGKLVPHPDESKVIERIIKLRQQGVGSSKIAKIFNEEGVPTKTGKKWHDKTILIIHRRETQKTKGSI